MSPVRPARAQSLTLSAIGVALGNGLTLVGSAVGLLLVANQFGLNSEMDAFWAIMPLSTLLGQVPTAVAWTLLIPAVSGLLNTGSLAEAWSVLIGFATVLVGGIVGLGIGLFVGAPLIVLALAPGLQPQAQAEAVFFLRASIPLAVLTALLGIMSAALNAHRTFMVPAVASAGPAWAAVLGVVSVGSAMGPASYIIGGTVGVIAAAAWVGIVLARRRPDVQIRFDWHHPRLRAALHSAVPVIAARSADQVPSLVLRGVASLLPTGAVTAVGLAGALIQPPTLVASAIASVLYPGWAASAAAGTGKHVSATVVSATRMTTWVLGGVALIGIALAPLVAVLVVHAGSADAETKRIELALCFAAALLGGPAIGSNYLVAAAFWANGFVRNRVLLEFGFLVLVIVCVAVLFPFGSPGLVLAQSSAFLALVVFGCAVLARKEDNLIKTAAEQLLGITLLDCLIGLPVFLLSREVAHVTYLPALILGGVGVLIITIVTYVAVTWLLRLPEPPSAWQLIAAWLTRFGARA